MFKKNLLPVLISTLLISCSLSDRNSGSDPDIDKLAADYVRLGLTIGLYDSDFVDAYYGPDSLKPLTSKSVTFPKQQLLQKAAVLKDQLSALAAKSPDDTLGQRASWLVSQLTAFERRIRVFSNEQVPFDMESKDLFDATAPVYTEQHFRDLISRLESLLPGRGTLPDRYQQMASRFLIPKSKIDTVFQAAIAEARKRTLAHYQLPANETFRLEYVTDKPWSGYNWYKGNYNSLIQINVSQPIFIERAIDLACHEGYPGHHVYNAMLEKVLFRDRGWVEVSLYPLFSPQSLIAEGSANYGISVAFPGNEQEQFCKDILLPLAGLDTTGTAAYFKVLSIKSGLGYARNEVARGLLSNKMTEKEALRWLTDYCLLTGKGASDYLRFIKKYRSYVINYNYGQDLVKQYIELQGGTADAPEHRWKLFEALISKQSRASELLKKH
ncbi:hypothetical protein [Dyadobacter aurulentus]|uniref:hypothetical protein n=1 Tax=Dyadobacter sp. UC 10 TaxID=2605428 RepID=UPI0011F32607|nr:hypothetical protein [Dyadobacter sp. UC 10]KAA0989582.1 hypothetical protein FXO21_05090 [Dyadobacter sp. UC 10]